MELLSMVVIVSAGMVAVEYSNGSLRLFRLLSSRPLCHAVLGAVDNVWHAGGLA